MSVMVVLLEFVRREIGNKKGPETRAWSDRCTHSQDASGQPNPSLEAGPRIRALALKYVMTFTLGRPVVMSPSHRLIKRVSRNTRAPPREVGRGLCRAKTHQSALKRSPGQRRAQSFEEIL